MRRAAALVALLLLPARGARAEVLPDWPCAGCVTVTPGGAGADARAPPAPLLVALHGDGGGVAPLVRAWQSAAAAAGVILLAPRCPRALGCAAGSWWQWLDTAGHDPAWLGAQIDAVTARFAVDPRRVYATGYSGGATYLGWYAPAHAARFAAVAHVAGGAAYRPPCPTCKVPVLFVLGAGDPMLVPYTRPLRDWYQSCEGHEIAWQTLPGVTHEGILPVLQAGKAREILGWLLARPAACLEEAPASTDAGATDAGAAPLADAGPAPQPAPAESAAAPPRGLESAAPPVTRVPPTPAGCACGAAAPGSPGAPAAAALALALGAARRRPRRCRPSGKSATVPP
jgi:predicted esterase